MMWEQGGWLLSRLCFSGPLLYIGLSMAIDPKEFVTLLELLSLALRRFEHRLHGSDWRERFLEPDVFHVSPRARIAVRLAGVVLSVLALAALIGAGPPARI